MSESGPAPKDQIVPLNQRSVIHVAPEEVMQPDTRQGPFREISLDARVLQIMLFSGILVAAVLGGFALLAFIFRVF